MIKGRSNISAGAMSTKMGLGVRARDRPNSAIETNSRYIVIDTLKHKPASGFSSDQPILYSQFGLHTFFSLRMNSVP